MKLGGISRLFLLVLVGLFGSVAPADAHLRLTSQDARYGDSQKAGPCGVAGGQRTTDKVYTAKPGTQVMLVWDEFIAHPSHYRIAFDEDGDDDFVDPILSCADQTSVEDCFETADTAPFMVNGIPDTPGSGSHNYLYTLPDVACENCTLQVIQAMYDKPPFVTPGNDIYYQCIDLILDPNGPDELTLVGGAPGGPDAGPGEDPDPDPDPTGGDPDSVSGGCAVGGAGTASTLAWVLLFAVLGASPQLPRRIRRAGRA